MHKTSQTANRFVFRSFTLTVVAAAALCSAAPRIADAKGGHGKSHAAAKVGLPSFMGPGEAAVRAAAEKALKSRKIVVVPGDELSAAAKSAHVKLDSNDGFKAVAKALDLTAIVTGDVTKKKATLTVHSGDDGSVAGEETFQGADTKKVAATVGKTFWKRLAGPFNKTKPPSGGSFEAPPPDEEPAAGGAEAANEPAESSPKKKSVEAEPARNESKEKNAKEKETEKPEGEASETKSEKSSQASSEGGFLPPGPTDIVDVSGGLGLFMRSLSFNQARNDLSTTQVANYSLPRAPDVVVRGDVFPLASSGGFVANLGLTLDLAYLLPVVTSPGIGGNYKTSGLQWAIGPKVRLPYGFFGTVAYGSQSFKLTRSNSDMPEAVVPGTDYKFVRVGTGIRSQVTSALALAANLDYLQCLGKPGDIGGSSYFPRTTCNGVEVGVSAGYRIRPQLEVRAGVDLRRFGLNFHVKSSDVNNDPSMTPPIAGGAVDQYLQFTVGIAYLMGAGDSSGGASSTSAESSTEDKPKKSKKEKEKDEKGSDEGGDSSEGGAAE